MESKNGLHDKEKQHSSKDILMEELTSVKPPVNSKEKSADLMNHNYFNGTSSSNTFSQSTIKDGKLALQLQERQNKANVVASRSVIAAVIVLVVGIFSVPIILYYTLKTDPIPELNSVLGDVNISMVTSL